MKKLISSFLFFLLILSKLYAQDTLYFEEFDWLNMKESKPIDKKELGKYELYVQVIKSRDGFIQSVTHVSYKRKRKKENTVNLKHDLGFYFRRCWCSSPTT